MTGGNVASEPANRGLVVLDERPVAGEPRSYRFPPFEREVLGNRLTVIRAHVPGRPLLVAHLLVHGREAGGATTEAADQGGVTVLTARAMTEGTARRNAVALIEASERLGAEISADAGWDSLGVGVEVPRSRLGPALELLAEVAFEPSFPDAEVERLRAERVNDLMQARADPRRRVERVFPEAIYAANAAYRRPLAGTEETVPGLGRAEVMTRHRELMRPDAATLLIAGDLSGVDLREATELFGSWTATAAPSDAGRAPDRAGSDGGQIVVVDRPGSPQSEVRVGHVGVGRRSPDFHALAVLNAIIGGLFGSRLNELLREQRGYTYGVHSAFDMRRGAGPFAVRCAVETDVTVPAVGDILGELERVRQDRVSDKELTIARDYLVGVFPLRFETAGQVAAAIAGLVTHDLPDDELDRYRPAVAAITADEVLSAAQARIRPNEASIVVVGDAARFVPALRDAGWGDVAVIGPDGSYGASASS